ncbi:MAG: S9 family peptidase [Candidatus Eremiobacteraeota bacterium]|nr:S9 family peptidase [Candidatus Eremiobacteraeota bacterium]
MAVVSALDFQRIVALHSPAIAPDGERAALVVSRTLWDDDRRRSDLVLVDLRTATTTTVLAGRGGLADPAFSPDGTQLAFLADQRTNDATHTQIFVMPAGGGEARPVTRAESDVDEFAWRPDGRALAYAAADPQMPRTGADRFRDSFVFTTEPITSRSFPEPDHLFSIDMDDGSVAQLTRGPQSVGGSTISWSPDGRAIAFTLCPNAITNDASYSQAAVVDVATKRVRVLTGRTMWESDPLFSPDGTHIAYTYSNGDPQIQLTQLYLTTPQGGPGALISAAIDRPVGDFVWSHDSNSLIVTAPDRTTNGLYRLTLRGDVQRLDVGNIVPGTPLNTTGGASVPSLSNALAADGTLLFLASSTAQPLELFQYSPRSGTVQQVTTFNAAMRQYDWATAQPIVFPTTTGVTADGALYYPPGFSPARKYPLVVFIHGGPGDPSMLEFDFWAQVMAARGWLVLRPNYRGSPNLGLRYQHAILNDPEEGPGKDIVSAVNAVRARGFVDDSRVAVCGWSYGGIMTAWLISKYHIWKAAVSGASVNDWIVDYGTADDSLADVDMLRGSPFVGDNAAQWRSVSAISYAADVTTPVLILSDVGDNRDPFATSSMYWRALRDNHKDATLRVWPVSGHFPDDPVRIVDIYTYWIDYIAQHFR